LTFTSITLFQFHRFYLSHIVVKLRFVNFLLNEYWIGLDLSKLG